MNLTANLKVICDFEATKTVQGQSAKVATALSDLVQLVTGTGAGKIDLIYIAKDATLAASSTNSYDLSGTLEDFFGDACVMAKLKGVILINTSNHRSVPTSPQLGLGGNASGVGGWIDTVAAQVVCDTGGWIGFVSPDGFTVTASTADILDVENLDGSEEATYTIIILGAST